MKQSFKNTGEKGGAYVELTIILPLLIAFLAGLIQLGHYLAQVDWIAQTAYLSALEGTQSFTPARMQARATQLSTALSDVNELETVVNTGSTDGANDTVTMTFGGSLSKIFGASPQIGFRLSAPRLSNSVGVGPGSLNQFENYTDPDGVVECRDCDLMNGTICAARSCADDYRFGAGPGDSDDVPEIF